MTDIAVWDSVRRGYRVFVGDLGSRIGKYELEREFKSYGSVTDVWVARNPPGFAFLVFKHADDAERAVRKLHGRVVCGRKVRVEHARPFEERRRLALLSRSSSGRHSRSGRDHSRERDRSRERKRSRSRSASHEHKKSRKHEKRSRSRSDSRSPIRSKHRKRKDSQKSFTPDDNQRSLDSLPDREIEKESSKNKPRSPSKNGVTERRCKSSQSEEESEKEEENASRKRRRTESRESESKDSKRQSRQHRTVSRDSVSGNHKSDRKHKKSSSPSKHEDNSPTQSDMPTHKYPKERHQGSHDHFSSQSPSSTSAENNGGSIHATGFCSTTSSIMPDSWLLCSALDLRNLIQESVSAVLKTKSLSIPTSPDSVPQYVLHTSLPNSSHTFEQSRIDAQSPS